MATSFPSSLDSFTNPSASDALDSVSVPHADQHANINDAMVAVQTKLGVGSGTIGTWTTYTPTVTSGTGTLTSYTAAGDYARIGDFVIAQFRVTITDNGTGATDIRVTLPVIAATGVGSDPNIGGAIENAIGGFFVQVELQSGVAVCRTVSYSYPGGTGRRIVGTVTYKAA